MAKISNRFRSADRHIQDFMQTIITAFNNQETKVGNTIGKGWDTAIHSIKEAWEKATGVVSAHSDITSAGAQIEDAVTKKHSQNTDTILRGGGETEDQTQTDYGTGGTGVYKEGPFAQTFKAGLTGSLTRINIRILKIDSTRDLIIEIRTTDANGLPTETILATETTPASSFPNNESIWLTVNFSTPCDVVAETTYALVIKAGETGVEDYYVPVSSTNNPYPDGMPYTYKTGSWVILTELYDFAFYTYVYVTITDIINNATLKTNLSVDELTKIGTKTIEEYQSAVDLKHTEGKLKADSTDPTAGFLDEKIDDSLVLVAETHKIRVQKLDGGAW